MLKKSTKRTKTIALKFNTDEHNRLLQAVEIANTRLGSQLTKPAFIRALLMRSCDKIIKRALREEDYIDFLEDVTNKLY